MPRRRYQQKGVKFLLRLHRAQASSANKAQRQAFCFLRGWVYTCIHKAGDLPVSKGVLTSQLPGCHMEITPYAQLSGTTHLATYVGMITSQELPLWQTAMNGENWLLKQKLS